MLMMENVERILVADKEIVITVAADCADLVPAPTAFPCDHARSDCIEHCCIAIDCLTSGDALRPPD